jgi:predicted nucleotidyltransferase
MNFNLENEITKAIASLTHWSGVKRIWLFGSSVKRPQQMDWRSDLDLAVEGLSPADYASAWSKLDAAVSLPIDLVRLETASPLLQQEIFTYGKQIYGSPTQSISFAEHGDRS